MKKADRQKVFDKYGGRCAYSGKELPSDWQVDHAIPKGSVRWLILLSKGEVVDKNNINNLMPALKILNHYKRCKDLEEWRTYLLTLHIRLKKLPKNTRVAKRQKTKEYMLSVAEAFGITADNPFSGVFYFEQIKET